MITFERKKRTNKADNVKNGILAQGGIFLAILIVSILILVSNFSVSSRDNAKNSVNQRLIDKTAAYAAKLDYDLMGMTYAGQSAAALISAQKDVDFSVWRNQAKLIKGSIPTPYLVAIVDMEGKGVTSENTTVNLSKMDYFVAAQTQKYVFTEDDGIMNKKAFISVVPIYKGRDACGMIYMYTATKEIETVLPINDFDGNPSFAVMDSAGNILAAAGRDTVFTKGSNLKACLEKSVLSDLSIEKIERRIEKYTKFAFAAQNGTENKTIVISPMEIGEWYLVMILNQSYVELERSNEWKTARTMVIDLAIVAVIFLCLLLVLVILNKIRYNERNKDLADKADTDLLTGLLNKIATENRIQDYLEENPDTQCMMFLFDIDNFKKINDTMGHAFGDEVLRSLGHQLTNEFRVTDFIGRTGGDEFIVFLKNIKEEEQLEKEGLRISNFFHRFNAGGEYVKYSATASIGAAVYPRDAKDFSSLYKAADNALYEAKKRGKKQLVFYNEELEKKTAGQRKEIPIDTNYTFS